MVGQRSIRCCCRGCLVASKTHSRRAVGRIWTAQGAEVVDAGRAYAGRVTPDNQPDVGKRVVFLHSYSRPHCGALATPHSRGAVRVEAHAAAAHDRGGRRHQQQVEGDADACGGSNQRLMGPGVQCRSAVCKLLNPGGWEPRGQARRWQAASALHGLHACPHLRLLPLLARARPETLHKVGQSVDEVAPEQAAAWRRRRRQWRRHNLAWLLSTSMRWYPTEAPARRARSPPV